MKRVKRMAGRGLGRTRRALAVRVGEQRVRFDTRHEIAKSWFYPRYAFGDLHEPALTALLTRQLRAGDVFFDVGANLGWFTLLAGALCQGGEVHSFEVDPRLTGLLLDSLRLNKLPARHRVNCLAVGEWDGRLVSFAPHIAGNPSTNQVSSDAKGDMGVGSVSLDKYCELLGILPTCVKIDVEGAELGVLRGMREVMRKSRPRLVVEIHPEQLADQNIPASLVIDEIAETVPQYVMWQIEHYRDAEAGELSKRDPGSVTWSDRPAVFYFEAPDS